MKKIKLVVVLFINVILFSACNKNTDNISAEAVGDIFVRCQKIGDKVKYAPVYYGFSNYPIKKAIVTTDKNKNVELKKYGEIGTTFRLVPEEQDFKTTTLSDKEYNFEITLNKGEVLKVKDKLFAEKSLPPMELVKIDYDKDNQHSFKIEWKKIDKADAYVIMLKESINGKVFFASKLILSQITKYEFNIDSQGWINRSISNDDDCVIVVSAYRYESSNNASIYDLNWESIATKKIKW